ncbi:MAG: hypothetical protein P4L93_07395 [Coriobacteriia bacterium]|nr:hypothetical protein [Coriobacteriia bacterium]
MTDEPSQNSASDKLESTEPVGAPTPEELLAETQADDPEVGSDGTGMGELP